MSTDPASLERLRDIALPGAISPWPPAPGVWWLAAIVALWLGLGVWGWRRHRRREAYRRAARAKLSRLRPRLAREDERTAALYELSRVLKRTALAAYARDEVAGLTGEAWLAFLDRTAGGEVFRSGAGRPLCELSALADPRLDRAAAEALADATLLWIGRHHRDADEDPSGDITGGDRAHLRA